MKNLICLAFGLGFVAVSVAQDSLAEKTMEEVTVSANKWAQNRNEVPNKITAIGRAQIYHYNPQTAADMLAQSGTVFVQKSQLGGGSPMIRGFATNRVLIVVDGIRMNNAIYRSGNLQNVISIDPLTLERTEVIFGPGSLIYGSDAIGGVMDFRTLQPRFTVDKKTVFGGAAFVRYATANSEHTYHADLSVGGKRLSFLASYTHSDFGDLKMGRRGPTQTYLRPEYVERINGSDVIVQNPNPRVQRFSGYEQDNILAKLAYKVSDGVQLQYGLTYAKTGDAPRYDRLIQYRNGALRFAEWNYGPMIWEMHSLTANITRKTAIADGIRLVAAYQDYEESRIDRTRGNNNRTTQAEGVKAYSFNADATKGLQKGALYYGIEGVYNNVSSTGMRTNIVSGVESPFASRYPNGSTWSTWGIYGSYKISVGTSATLTAGLRYNYNTLDASFDTTFVKFPYKDAQLKDGALTGNAGLVYSPNSAWQINAAASTGYRMPNVDDIGKLFESTPGNLTVPNPDLKPEYAINFEGGITRSRAEKYKLELTGFYTILTDAIVRRPFTFNGQDSVEFSGTKSRVEALQNVAKAAVYGIQAGFRFYVSQHVYLQSNANWTWGKETDDAKNEQVALRHAPPFYGSTHLHYQKQRFHAEGYVMYNGEVEHRDLAPSEATKTDIYALDPLGKPFSPSWATLNAKVSYGITKHLLLTAGWENITNVRYRPYSSGIVAAGSNLIFSLRASF